MPNLRRSQSDNQINYGTVNNTIENRESPRFTALRKTAYKIAEQADNASDTLTSASYKTLMELTIKKPTDTDLRKSLSELSVSTPSSEQLTNLFVVQLTMNDFIDSLSQSETLEKTKIDKLKSLLTNDPDLTLDKFKNAVLEGIDDRRIKRLLNNLMTQFFSKKSPDFF